MNRPVAMFNHSEIFETFRNIMKRYRYKKKKRERNKAYIQISIQLKKIALIRIHFDNSLLNKTISFLVMKNLNFI